MASKSENFEWLLDHELLLAKRYGRPLTLAFIETASQNGSFEECFWGVLRDCDIYSVLTPSCAAILMCDTDPEGAHKALERFRSEHGQQAAFPCGIVSYPQDNCDTLEFLRAGFKRLRESKGPEGAEPSAP